MRLISAAVAGVALGLGLALGANVSGWILAGYGAVLALGLALSSRSPDGLRRVRHGLAVAWNPAGLSGEARRLARLKLAGSTLILLLMVVALAGELA